MKNNIIKMTMTLLKVIIEMAEIGEDYYLIMSQYNDLIEEYDLPLFKIKWISSTEFDFIKNKNKEEK